jgi:glycine/D-amino acid oxidase-like deaminating enzyme/nitrite reductase/ring-hydroxylating ferredoxin subunit
VNVENERSRSLWMQTDRPKAGPLSSDLRVETLVVGAGIAGLSTAYELMLRGHQVAVVDRGAIGGGMTARTSAHLSSQVDDRYARVIERHGEETASRYFDSQRGAIDRIEAICRDAKIECDFKRIDLYLFAPDSRGLRALKKEIDAASTIGFTGVEWSEAPFNYPAEGCLKFPDQARFHPLRYLSGLCRAIKSRGGRLYSNTPIVSVEETARGVAAKTESGHTITAHALVAATNAPFVNRVAVHNKQAPCRTYVMAAPVPKGSVVDALMWDTEDPYHYVRIAPREKDDLLIFGGEDHKSGTSDDAEERLKRLEGWARERFAKLGAVEDAWSGQIYEPADYLPFIGRSPGHRRVFIVTGDSGEGLTTGVATSLILPDLIEGKKNEWAKAYSPRRKVSAPSIIERAKDLLSAAKHVVEHVTGAESPEEIPRGKGVIIKAKGKKHAAYRDKNGELHVMQAACTHLGCAVQWNSFEECWDCPCHGSQFAPTGEALQCPATSPLKAADIQIADKAAPASRRAIKQERAEKSSGRT